MMRRHRHALVVAVTLLAIAHLAGQETPVFRGSAEAVTVGVSVRRGNRPVTGLAITDFALTDNGIAQTITALGYLDLPVDLTVLLDVSGSVSGAVLDQLRRSVGDLRRSLQAHDRVRLVTFNMRVQRLLDLDAPQTAIEAAFASVTSGGSSAVLDALAVTLASGGAPDRRQLIVLFSDGRDSISISRPDTLLDVARRTTPTVSVVLATPTRRTFDRVYTDLAAETGGTVVSLLPTDTLGDSLRRTLEQFRSSYVLTYNAVGMPAPGAHWINVKVNRPGVDVRARRGYVVP